MKHIRMAVWAGVTAVALAGTAGCGGASTQAAEAVSHADAILAALGRATDRTEALGSAEVRMSTVVGNGSPIAMEGTYSWGDGFAYDVEMDTAAAQMETLTDDPTIHCLLVDGAYYYDTDPQPSGPLEGKEWMKVDASAMFGEQGAEALSGSGGGSPAASMRSLKYANDVEDLGTETVNGQSTTHYRAEIDAAQMDKFRAADGEDNALDAVTGGSGSTTTDIWVGAEDLPVRLKQQIGTMTVTMDFVKFGATAEIQAPPAAQTGDLTEAVKDAYAQQGTG
ncbi:hypothetical protein ACFYPC_13305 [Streptomyces sp. NPDC005808]|uniref:hypothetical protein n=1 Tax=Streptomyces sp. NPDC005808 TaxID=3364734 RepID=UPI003684BD72